MRVRSALNRVTRLFFEHLSVYKESASTIQY
jgi:hypothetical protein